MEEMLRETLDPEELRVLLEAASQNARSASRRDLQ